MPLLRYLRPTLERLLEVSVQSETSARERALEKDLKNLNKKLASHENDAKAACAQLGLTIQDLQHTVEQLNGMLKNRNDRIEELEHAQEILKQDIKGMASVNARMVKWVECIRTAEEKDTLSLNLAEQLAAVQDTNPWQTI